MRSEWFSYLACAGLTIIGAGIATAQIAQSPELSVKRSLSDGATTSHPAVDGIDGAYWIEPETQMMWTRRDNGADLTWKEAVSYCQTLSLSGYRDWWLPAINDLARIYSPGERGHVKGGIQLSRPWLWSVSQPENEHAARDSYWHGATYGIYRETLRSEFLFFGDGTQNFDKAESRDGFRAVCVRWANSTTEALRAQSSKPISQGVPPALPPSAAPNSTPAKNGVESPSLNLGDRGTPELLGNEIIIKLAKAGLGDAVIVSMINSQPGRYAVTPTAVIALKEAGVSDGVISAMVANRGTLPVPAVEDERLGKPKVYVSDSESWASAGGFTVSHGSGSGSFAGGSKPQTVELIKTFGQRCPPVIVTMDKTKADYVVLFDRESAKGVALRRDKIAVFKKNGDVLYSGSTRSLGNAVQDSCTAIETEIHP